MDVSVMRQMQPTTASPLTRSMPYSSASVPSRNQPRNMTGIYLGLEGNRNPPAGNRGLNGMRVRKGVSAKFRTPAEEKRHKMVELLRIKEDKRGFSGQPLKRRQPQEELLYPETPSPRCSHPEQLQHRKWGPAKSANPHRFEDVIRQNPRNYTAINNNGVTRSENLTGLMSFAEQYGWDIASMPLPDTLVEEVHRLANTRDDLAGLEDCFKKVCKGNVDSLHSLLPLRKGSSRPDSYTTGFSVRSYRNPNKAELLADFEVARLPQNNRPKTVPASLAYNNQSRQPLVPAPYFFKHYNKPGTAHSKKRNSPTSQFEDQGVLNGEKILGGPGSGVITRSLKQGRHSAWSEGDAMKIRRGSPRIESPLKESDRQLHVSSTRHDNTPSGNAPLEIRAEGYQPNSESERSLTDPVNTQRTSNTTTHRSSDEKIGREKIEIPVKVDTDTSRKTYDMDGRTREPTDNTIRLDLETEDGKKQEIFIDEEDLSNEQIEKKQKASEAKFASIQEDAKQRKKKVEQLLDEHAEIVTTIVRQSSHDSTNETFQSAQEERDQ